MTTKLTPEQIDNLKYYDAVKAVRSTGLTGSWISNAKTPILKSVLRGEMTPDQARDATFGAAATAAIPAPATDLLSAALKAAVQPQIDALREQLNHNTEGLMEAIDEAATKAIPAAVPTELVNELNALKKRLETREENIAKIKEIIAEAVAKGQESTIPRAIAPVLGIKIPEITKTDDPVLPFFQRFCQPGAALKPVLVKGGQGSGKTFGAREWGKKFDTYIEFGFNPETSPSDMLGFPTATSPWVDGPITRAWRLAAAGKRVFVLLDEIYRAQKSARQAMLTPLSKRRVGDQEFYALNTGRPIIDPVTGVEGSEEILAPVENLAIVATTNVGARFDVEPDCPAGKERFVPVHVEVEEAKLHAVLSASAVAKGYSSAVVDKLISFWRESKILAADNFLEICPTTRILNEALLYSIDEKDVPSTLAMLGMNIWVAETLEGLPEPEQVKKVQAAISKHFGK